MKLYTVYHNPRCGKSRDTLKLLQEKVSESEITIVEYLKTVPSEEEIKSLLEKLNITADQLVRVKEKDFAPYKGQQLSNMELIALMSKIPKLIERPIVVKGDKAILGRPPENVLELI